MIRLRGVSKTFGSTTAIELCDLEIPKNRVIGLIGPSGCGKSTLLRLMAGLLRPDSGDIELAGGPPTPEKFGYVIQDGGLFPHMTARRNALLPATHGPRQRRPDRAALAARLDDLAGLVHLSADQLDRFPSELSGGQRQRVALVRALILDPPALLLDEPLGALDPVIRSDLQRELRALFDRLGRTVVLVTHDLAEAATLADEIVLMNAGRVAQRGAFDELVRDPADDFVRTFVREQVDRVRALLDGTAA